MAYILIVDDDEDFAEVVATVLGEAGHETQIELDTERGLQSIDVRRPDLMVLDVMFPEDSTAGFDMARAIRRKDENLPVLMLTAVNARFPLGFTSKDIDEDWLPVSDFLEKPVDLDLLVEKVNGLLARVSKG